MYVPRLCFARYYYLNTLSLRTQIFKGFILLRGQIFYEVILFKFPLKPNTSLIFEDNYDFHELSMLSSYLNPLEDLIQKKEFKEKNSKKRIYNRYVVSIMSPPLEKKQNSQTDILPTTCGIQSNILPCRNENESDSKLFESCGNKFLKRNGYCRKNNLT